MQSVPKVRLGKKKNLLLYLALSPNARMFKVGVTYDLKERSDQLGNQLFDWKKGFLVSAAEDWLIEGLEYQIKKACRAFCVPRDHVAELRNGYTEVFWIEAWDRAVQFVTCLESNPAFGVNRTQLARSGLPEPDSIAGRKPATVATDAESQMSLEIAISERLFKLNVHANELEIVRSDTLQKHIAYTSLNADQRRVIDYMCRSVKVDEIERDRRIWRANFGFFRKLFPNPKTREEVEAILDRLVKSEFRIRHMETGTEEKFSWLKQVYYCDNGSIEIEVSAQIAEYHRLPITTELYASERYTRYCITVPMGLLLQHQNLFHFVLERLKNTRLKLTARPMEVTIEELRRLWGLSSDTKPYDLERYWLKDACERISVATPTRILRYEPLRSTTRGRPVHAYRLHITEETKTDFLKRFERCLEPAKQQLATKTLPCSRRAC